MLTASRIREARLEAGLTQESLARMCGVSYRQAQRWEAGTSEPLATQVAAIAKATGTSADWLLTPDADAGDEDEAASASSVELLASLLPVLREQIRRALSEESKPLVPWDGIDRRAKAAPPPARKSGAAQTVGV